MPHVVQLLQNLPNAAAKEVFETILQRESIRVERIISQGQTTPDGEWYDQSEHEWVMVLQGSAVIEIDGQGKLMMKVGDAIDLPAHCRHRVTYTASGQPTVWLAVFYGSPT